MDDCCTDHLSAYSYDKCYPPPPAPYATVLPAQDYTFPYYSGFVGNIPTTQRRVLSELQPDVCNPVLKPVGMAKLPVGVIPPPEPWAGTGIVTPGQSLHAGAVNQPYQSASGKEPMRDQHVEQLYDRLRDRGARLQVRFSCGILEHPRVNKPLYKLTYIIISCINDIKYLYCIHFN